MFSLVDTSNGKHLAGFNHETNMLKVGGYQKGPFMTVQDMVAAAGMGYAVVRRQAYGLDNNGTPVPVLGQFHLHRTSDGKTVDPSTVSKAYHPYSTEAAAQILQHFVDQGYAAPHSAMVLDNGTVEVIEVKLHSVPGSDGRQEYYFGLKNSHGGSGPVTGYVRNYNLFCANQVVSSVSHSANFKIRHSSKVEENVEIAAQQWKEARAAIKTYSDALAKLEKKRIDIPDFFDTLLGIKGKEASEIPTRTENKRDALIRAANMPDKGTNGKTAYDAFQAVTYYNTHNSEGKGAGSAIERFGGVLAGSRGKFEVKAFSSLLELAAA